MQIVTQYHCLTYFNCYFLDIQSFFNFSEHEFLIFKAWIIYEWTSWKHYEAKKNFQQCMRSFLAVNVGVSGLLFFEWRLSEI